MARSRFAIETVEIAAGATASAAIDGRDWDSYTIHSGAGTGTSIGFTVSDTYGGTYNTLRSSGNTAASITTHATAGTYPVADSVGLMAAPWFKIVSGSTESSGRTFIVYKWRRGA